MRSMKLSGRLGIRHSHKTIPQVESGGRRRMICVSKYRIINARKNLLVDTLAVTRITIKLAASCFDRTRPATGESLLSRKTGDEMRNASATARRSTRWLGHGEDAVPKFTATAITVIARASSKMRVASHNANPPFHSRTASFIPAACASRRGRRSSEYSTLPPITSWSSFEPRELYHASR